MSWLNPITGLCCQNSCSAWHGIAKGAVVQYLTTARNSKQRRACINGPPRSTGPSNSFYRGGEQPEGKQEEMGHSILCNSPTQWCNRANTASTVFQGGVSACWGLLRIREHLFPCPGVSPNCHHGSTWGSHNRNGQEDTLTSHLHLTLKIPFYSAWIESHFPLSGNPFLSTAV